MKSYFLTMHCVWLLAILLLGCGNDQVSGQRNGTSKENTSSSGGKVDAAADRKKVKRIAAAILAYHEKHREFPWANERKDNEVKLSWRVKLLPFLDASELHDSFKLDESWDSESNQTLINKGADLFSLSNGKFVSAVRWGIHPRKLTDLDGGPSRCVMLVENSAIKPSDWTKPVDMASEEAIRLLKSMSHDQSLITALCDGSVRQAFGARGRDIDDREIMGQFAARDRVPASHQLFQTKAVSDDMNKLRRIAEAIQKFHDQNKKYPWVEPPGMELTTGWRVKVLPFFGDEGRKLHAKYKLDEPWDSPTNKALTEKGKKFYSVSENHLVSAVLTLKNGTLFPIRMSQVLDGTYNTVMLIENPELNSDLWSKPVDTKPDDAIKLLKSMDSDQILHTASYSGTVQIAYGVKNREISEEELKAPFVYNDGIPFRKGQLFQPSN